MAFSLSQYSSNFSAGTSKAMWFIEACAVSSEPTPGRPAGLEMPGTDAGAFGNQKNASESPLPMSKKKCWPMSLGRSSVLVSGMPSTSR